MKKKKKKKMGLGGLGFSLFLILLLFQVVAPLVSSSSSSSSSKELNTDGFFISDFLQKMGLTQISSYDFSSPVCSWEGVTCDVDNNQNVIGFVASSSGLSGLIPELTIGKLSKLESLDLSNNKITSLPSDFWSLGSHLKTLNLSHNHISGSIPTNIGNFGSLQSLDLSFNNFSGEIPESFSSLLSLQVVKMNQNGFNGRLPNGILKCGNVVSVDVSGNGINGSLPDGFGTSFLKLQRLDLSENGIHGRSSDFSGLKSLTHLNISRNFFQGSVMGVFQDPLQVIDLGRNQFQGHISQVHFDNSSFNWSNLVFLDVSENQLSGEFFHDLNNEAKNLKYLNLGHNRFSNQEFPLIQKLASLEYLNLSKTSLRGRIPCDVSQLVSLRTLDLSQNHLNGSVPRLDIETLDILDVSFNNLTGEIPSSLLAKLPQMERFNFSSNNLSYCASQLSPQTRKTAFQGLLYSCPIAVKPDYVSDKTTKHKGMQLILAVTLAIVCCTVGLVCLLIGCRRKTRMWAVKRISFKEEARISGPFSFQTDSTTWVADVKQATAVPVVIFEKPLLNFTFVDLLTATSHFDRGTLLAEGRFGPVYRGFLPGGIQVAVKVLVLGSTMADQEAARELESLGRIKHPNLVPLSGYCLAGDQRIAIYDYMENGNLQNLLHDIPLGVQTTEDWSTDAWEEDNNAGIRSIGIEGILTSWRFRHKIALGTARALSFLHHGCSPPIIHRDVKASSVYLDSELEPRLSDFGLAKIFGNAAEEHISRGSPGYIPPEYSESEHSAPTPKSDVYGFGVVLLELITGKKPAGDEYSEEPNLVSWVRGLVRKNQGLRVIDPKIRDSGPEKQMEEAVRIGYLCTADLPAKRPSMQQIVGLLKDIEPVVHE